MLKRILDRLDDIAASELKPCRPMENEGRKTLLSLKDIPEFNEASDEQQENIIALLGKRHIGRMGIPFRGHQITFDKDTKQFYSENKSVGSVHFFVNRNRVYCRVSMDADSTGQTDCQRSCSRLRVMNESDHVYHVKDIDTVADNIINKDGSKGVRAAHLRITSDIEHFYEFDGMVIAALTPKMVEKYQSDPCDVYRHTPNVDSTINGFGLTFVTWSTKLIEVGYGSVYVDEDMTSEEATTITKGFEDTWVSKEIALKMKAYEKKHSGGDASIVEEVETKISECQQVIDNSSAKIVEEAYYYFKNDTTASFEEKERYLATLGFGLDCGFLSFYFEDETLNEKAKTAGICGLQKTYDGRFTLKLPVFNQSLTVMKKMAEVAEKIIFEKTGIKLLHYTMLD